ncbi:MAG TPA: YggS family pyridoxal phosphate-dependent enzyme [Saprospiraceae bacterium]|nr:YggS family pyridoxal phosphate-dependent enzyme [Saprospiraceae bacterium]
MIDQSEFLSWKQELNEKGVQLVAVSKVHPAEKIMTLYKWGHRDFGENKVQELVNKYQELPKDIQWHLIGHLQRNKVKDIVAFVALIHAVDSERLLNKIEKEAAKLDRRVPILLQLKIAEEESKYGLNKEQLISLSTKIAGREYPHIQLKGLMGMASFTDDKEQVRREFSELKAMFDFLKKDIFSEIDAFNLCSMGMSGDYKIAMEQGSNMIRVGSSIFGPRPAH